MLVCVKVEGTMTVEVEGVTVTVATVDTAIFVTAGTLIKLEQKGVAFCSFKMSTMKLTSWQKLGGAAKAACTRRADKATNLEGVIVKRLREPPSGKPCSSQTGHRKGICILESVVHSRFGVWTEPPYRTCRRSTNS